jgi:hypothetical protein
MNFNFAIFFTYEKFKNLTGNVATEAQKDHLRNMSVDLLAHLSGDIVPLIMVIVVFLMIICSCIVFA